MKTEHKTKDEGNKKEKRRIPRTRRMCNRTKIQFALFIGIGTRAYININSLTHLPRMKYISNAFTNKRDSIYPSARRSKHTHTHTRRMERLTENEYTQGYYLRLIYTIFIFYRARGVPLVRII